MSGMKRLTLLLVALLVLGALPARSSEPETPLDLNGLTLNLAEDQIQARLGPPVRQVDDQLRQYPGNLLMRLRDGSVVNLSVYDEQGQWTLGRGGAPLARTGCLESELRAALAEPKQSYASLEKPLRALLYWYGQADLVVLVRHGRVVGFMLAEPGVMANSLPGAGFAPEGSDIQH